jgi:hypothetical protein
VDRMDDDALSGRRGQPAEDPRLGLVGVQQLTTGLRQEATELPPRLEVLLRGELSDESVDDDHLDACWQDRRLGIRPGHHDHLVTAGPLPADEVREVAFGTSPSQSSDHVHDPHGGS